MATREVSAQELAMAVLLGGASRASGGDYLYAEALPDGRWVYLLPKFEGYRLGVSSDRHDQSFQDVFDYDLGDEAWVAALGWDGQGDPEGWRRHWHAGEIPRRRPDGRPESEFRAP